MAGQSQLGLNHRCSQKVELTTERNDHVSNKSLSKSSRRGRLVSIGLHEKGSGSFTFYSVALSQLDFAPGSINMAEGSR